MGERARERRDATATDPFDELIERLDDIVGPDSSAPRRSHRKSPTK
jgi:hypothetical protein